MTEVKPLGLKTFNTRRSQDHLIGYRFLSDDEIGNEVYLDGRQLVLKTPFIPTEL